MEFDSLLIAAARQHIIKQPLPLTSSFYHDEQQLWVKRRPDSKQTVWHRLQHALTYLVRLPIFHPTVSLGGAASLQQESARLRAWAAHNLAVPVVRGETSEFIITTDVGKQLHHYLGGLTDNTEKQAILHQAAQALNQVHCHHLCHGRPSLKDMTWHEGHIFFIDLEEDPLVTMSLAQAQARDIWLFLNSAANHSAPLQNGALLISLFNGYKHGIAPATIEALTQMVTMLKPLRVLMGLLPKKLHGRDIRCAMMANRALEQVLVTAG